MKKITLTILTALATLPAFSQVLIDPAAEGGFEVGPTWTDNGWTVVNPNNDNLNKRWYLGTGQTGYSGQRAAFIGNDETTVGNANGARKIHFYRSVDFPAGATNIVLTFKYKQEVADASSDGEDFYDYIQVNTAQATPVAGNEPPGAVRFGPFPTESVPLFTTQTVNLPNGLAGTTRTLIFTFIADNVNPRGFGAIDDISLTYTATASIPDANKKVLRYYPNPLNDVLTISHEGLIDNISVYNMLGQQVLAKSISTTEAQVDLSALPGGNYMVRVTAEGISQTIKITKK